MPGLLLETDCSNEIRQEKSTSSSGQHHQLHLIRNGTTHVFTNMEFCTCFRLFINSFFHFSAKPVKKRKHKPSQIYPSLRISDQRGRHLSREARIGQPDLAEGYGTINSPYQTNGAMELNSNNLDKLWSLLESDGL